MIHERKFDYGLCLVFLRLISLLLLDCKAKKEKSWNMLEHESSARPYNKAHS